MRFGYADLPESENEILELKKEAEYYLLNGLADLCEYQRPVDNFRTCTADELMRVIVNTKKKVIVINYLTHEDRLVFVPTGFNFCDFMERHKDKVEVVFFNKLETEYSNTASVPPHIHDVCWRFNIYNATCMDGRRFESMKDLERWMK
ncbi:Cilia- and flagella-associated protein 299 [Caenorhabditis elegans]|uniref:Cilia- and flagella-associated protein 299 n=1 Tax=Caenorhabditis elegans TaxID=6239 RepID=O16611_CAEEL|nr:Cilia- and flagella-associated protein 299 [Caenorhabditis elegans]CCD61635.1 Cilia- and flagella-associated protein 299 [Caenorhabditis elegans]|eukprot:NP_494229.2 Uncharacterized protein CELE_B0281.4 [Caenorhabditis elegans]